MAAIKGNKAKGRRSSRHKGKYEAQRFRTAANKARRAAKRTRRKAKGLAKKARRTAGFSEPVNPHTVHRATRKAVRRIHSLVTASLQVIAGRCWA